MVYFLSVDGAKLYVFSESTPILKGVFLEMNVFFSKDTPSVDSPTSVLIASVGPFL
jgi:hypothetical protein